MELKNFEDHGDDGEVWFGKDVQKKTVEFLMNRFSPEDKIKTLDVGTGNGALLFKLAKKGFPGLLVGIDYSDWSVALCKKIQEARAEDYERAKEIVFRFENAFDLLDGGEYDVIHDKGTFDVVVMN